MKPLVIWPGLVVIAVAFVGLSVWGNPSQWQVMAGAVASLPWRETTRGIGAWLNTLPFAPIVGAMGLVVLVALMRRARRSRQASAAAEPFASHLATALIQPAAGIPVSRLEQVGELARQGHSAVDIARRTRLSRDAVRTVLGRAAECG